MVNIPIVGKVTAGVPILATENIEDYFPTVVVVSMLGNSEYKNVEFDYLSLDFNFTNIDILLGA